MSQEVLAWSKLSTAFDCSLSIDPHHPHRKGLLILRALLKTELILTWGIAGEVQEMKTANYKNITS